MILILYYIIMILLFSNQKGGVGKSTLAALYANHLANGDENAGIMPRKVQFIEADMQRSLSSQREEDVAAWGSDNIKYDLDFCYIKDYDTSLQLMQQLRQFNEQNPDVTIIIDAPGNITQDYLAPLFIYCDYIVCPYSYQNIVLDSTSGFIRVIEYIKSTRSEMNTQFIFIPNRVVKGVGINQEIENFQKIEEIFKTKGYLTPRVYNRVDLARFNTAFNTPRQERECEKCFAFIDNIVLQENNI